MLPDVIADFIQNWLEDNINPELYTNMDKTIESLPNNEKFKNNVIEFFDSLFSKRLEGFESQLTKFETI